MFWCLPDLGFISLLVAIFITGRLAALERALQVSLILCFWASRIRIRVFWASRIRIRMFWTSRIHKIRMFLGLPDPDP